MLQDVCLSLFGPRVFDACFFFLAPRHPQKTRVTLRQEKKVSPTSIIPYFFSPFSLGRSVFVALKTLRNGQLRHSALIWDSPLLV